MCGRFEIHSKREIIVKVFQVDSITFDVKQNDNIASRQDVVVIINDGIPDLMVKFKRSDVINLLDSGDNVPVRVTGTVGTMTFEGIDTIRVIP
jgi:hypothetical protein